MQRCTNLAPNVQRRFSRPLSQPGAAADLQSHERMHVQVSTSRYLYCLRLTDTHTLSVRPVLARHIQQFLSTLQTGLLFTAAWCPTAPEQTPFISGHSHTNTPWPGVRFSHSLSLSPCYTQFNRTTNGYGFPILLYWTTTAWPSFTGFRTLDGLGIWEWAQHWGRCIPSLPWLESWPLFSASQLSRFPEEHSNFEH